MYKDKINKWHDAKILRQEICVGESVHLYNSSLELFARKLRSKWLGPFVICNVYPIRAIELEDHKRKRFAINGQRVKHYKWKGLG